MLAGLELANALVASDASVMETMCLVGIVPTVSCFATAAWAKGIRLQAARFVQQLCRTSLATAQMFVACQVCAPTSGFVKVSALYKHEVLGTSFCPSSGFHSPVVGAMNLQKDLHPHDQMYLVHITEAEAHPSVTATGSMP